MADGYIQFADFTQISFVTQTYKSGVSEINYVET